MASCWRSGVPLLAWLLAACGGTRDATAPVAPPAPTVPAPVVGALQVTVSGLPAGALARVTVSGPGGTVAVTGTTTLSALSPGRYTITAVQVAAGPALYDPLEASQQRDVLGGATAAVAVGHALSRQPHPVVVRLVDSVRAAFSLPALAGAIVTADDRVVAWGWRALGAPPAGRR